MIDQFADATDDHQFIHVDPARAAKETRSAVPSRMASCFCRCCRR
jgi:acyl dehydratase